ncbi:alkyl sulfatase dimerization domain-containing protein [Endozoicomonas arenosclerae]|uniref:alkyl sulfatase dimerization domain-containing protein n=1 Tax=Endozoicomonas arenosclerae TaxID=1633495 RepID=UPI0007839522|nr:alkyl sulfatase dimerization domain-containing protein [Endozoicomonas arenosclerae]
MREPIYKSRPVAPEPARLGGERINDFIIMSEGFSNCYLIETPAGNIQINSGMGFEAPIHKKNFESFSTGSAKYLILTQGHVDHVGGVGYFREAHDDLKVIAQTGNTEHQAYDQRLSDFRGNRSAFAFTRKFVDVFQYYADQGLSDFPAQDAPAPDILFEDKYCFTLGGLDIELIAVPGAETNDSLIVWLPQHDICFTGNLFGCPFGHFPNLVTIRGDRYRDALTVASAVQTVLDLEPEMIVYGHHSPVVGKKVIQEELTCLRDAIFHVHDETVKGMNEGKDVHTLMKEISIPPEIEVGQGYGKVSWGVRAIWEHYAGWFHHQSTTELYDVPQSSVYGDLVELAGGIEVLVDRAQQKVLEGRYEEALHLLDIAFSKDDNEEALSTAVEIHQKLKLYSENFWLTSWLENQVDQLNQRKKLLLKTQAEKEEVL